MIRSEVRKVIAPQLFIFARGSSGMLSKGLEIGQQNLVQRGESLCKFRKGQGVDLVLSEPNVVAFYVGVAH